MLGTINNMSDTKEVLDSISSRLNNIDAKLDVVTRLEERINNHNDTLKRYGPRLDSHSLRLKEGELWRAQHGDPEHKGINEKVKELDNSKEEEQKDVIKGLLKWISGGLGIALTIFLTWLVTKGT